MIFLFILFNSFLYAELQDSAQVLQKIKIIPKDSLVIIKDSTSINNSLIKDSISINRSNIINDSIDFIENFKFNEENDIFYEQLIESKLTFADAITYDISLDTLEAEVQFQSLFASFEFLDSLSLDDEYKRIEYNMVLNASIDYYQNKSVTINRLESPLSMALFKEKLEAYFYKQQLEDVEFVDEPTGLNFVPV